MAATEKWSQDVTEHSNALDLEKDVFTRDDPKSIALSLKPPQETSSNGTESSSQNRRASLVLPHPGVPTKMVGRR